MMVAGGSDVPAVVEGAKRVETACLWLSWGEVGSWEAFRGCCNGSSSVFCCFRAAAGGSEWGRAGGSAIVDECVDGDLADPVDA
jgi:hypothetical protein